MAKGVWIWLVFYKEGVASGGQRLWGVTRESFCADAIEIPNKDVGADKGDRAINGGRADRPYGRRATRKEEEPPGKVARAD